MKYQLVCPKCHHEFQYDNGYYDRNIARLSNEIRDINMQLAEYKLLPYSEQQWRMEWLKRTRFALTCKQKELGELKAIRKVSDQQIQRMKYDVLNELVKERFGSAVYDELIEEVDEELKAYKLSGLMRHEYSRAGGKGVANINNV